MDDALSLSKGCFVFNTKKKPVKKSKQKTPPEKKEMCYGHSEITFRKVWEDMENKLQILHENTFSETLHHIAEYIDRLYCPKKTIPNDNTIVPTAVLLTGVNMPDHGALFSSLVDMLHKFTTPHVAVLQSEKCVSLRSTVTQMAMQFMNAAGVEDGDLGDDDGVAEKVKKSDCNFPVLLEWYQKYGTSQGFPPRKKRKSRKRPKPSTHKLVIIIPEFESFSSVVLQDFILILSGYTEVLPLVLVLGVATTVGALQRSLPYHVSARMCIEVFEAPSSSQLLNQMLEKVVFDPESPFQLGAKVFKFLMDIFLFYDFSVKGFVQGLKYCMMVHFYGQNWKIPCCLPSDLEDNISMLSAQDLDKLRSLPSFRKYLEDTGDAESPVNLYEKNDFFKKVVKNQLLRLREQLCVFYTALTCLHTLTHDLPKSPLGTQVREIYALAVSSPVASCSEFQESFQLLGFQSKEELLGKLDIMLRKLECEGKNKLRYLNVFSDRLSKFRDVIQRAGHEPHPDALNIVKFEIYMEGLNRRDLREQLLQRLYDKPPSTFEVARKDLLKYLSVEAFPLLLKPPTTLPMAEILFFNEVSSVRCNIIGTPRASIHTALSDPHVYLECECCKVTDESSLLPSMPDVSIAYKLYLESGRLINLYDWLQAFVAVVCPDEANSDEDKISPRVQARFTQAVAELQFLGFVKPSNRKTDHVCKLTFN